MISKKIYEQMLSGKMYNDLFPGLVKKRQQAVFLTNRYNSSYGEDLELREKILKELLCRIGYNVHFEPNFRCEFGFNITIRNNFFANFDCIMLNGNQITIGDNVLFAPRTGLYTANHAIHPLERISGGCYAHPIVIKNKVWISAGAHVLGGATIGENTIIGAGNVVTKNIPANVIAAVIPCRVIQDISDKDRTEIIAN